MKNRNSHIVSRGPCRLSTSTQAKPFNSFEDRESPFKTKFQKLPSNQEKLFQANEHSIHKHSDARPPQRLPVNFKQYRTMMSYDEPGINSQNRGSIGIQKSTEGSMHLKTEHNRRNGIKRKTIFQHSNTIASIRRKATSRKNRNACVLSDCFRNKQIQKQLDALFDYYTKFQEASYSQKNITDIVIKCCFNNEELKGILLKPSGSRILTNSLTIRRKKEVILRRFHYTILPKKQFSTDQFLFHFREFMEKIQAEWLKEYKRRIESIESSITQTLNCFRGNLYVSALSTPTKYYRKNPSILNKIQKFENRYGAFDQISDYQIRIYDMLEQSKIRVNNLLIGNEGQKLQLEA